MITDIQLTETGAAKFSEFLAQYAKPELDMQAATFAMLDIMLDRAASGESLSYELGSQYTNTGRPEIFRLDAADIDTEEIDD